MILSDKEKREWDKFSEICERDYGVRATGVLWDGDLYLLGEKRVEITPREYDKIYEEIKWGH